MKILYFASIRERLNRGEETVFPPADIGTVADLMTWLAAHDEGISHAFADRRLVRTAIDARIVGHDASLDGATVIAFFPPMTGG